MIWLMVKQNTQLEELNQIKFQEIKHLKLQVIHNMMVIKEDQLLDKKSKGSGITNESNYYIANELHKPIVKKLKKRKMYSSFKEYTSFQYLGSRFS